ncbi:MAG TPA: dienelactone hydrolase family protein [Ktedonobacterales bacterium]|jgi:predicted esterase
MVSDNLHRGQPIVTAGSPLERATIAMIMLHGRGASASGILSLADEFGNTDVAYLAPQPAGSTWYPNRFSAPVESNEPWLSSALGAVADALSLVATAGIPLERTLLLGFSQGACLALEYVARNPKPYGGLAGLSGALIENGDKSRLYQGTVNGAPVFLGCSTTDPHVPKERVERSAEIFRSLGAEMTLRLYPNLEHIVNSDEVEFVRGMIANVQTLPEDS